MDVKRKKLVGLIHHLEIGGAERMMVTVLNHFSEDDFEVHLIVFNYKGALKEQLAPNIIVHDLNIASVSKGMLRCLKEIYSIKPDIVFTGIGHLNITLASFVTFMKKLLSQTKWIARETNIVSLQNKTANYPKLFDWLYKKFYHHYDVIIAQSQDMKEDLEENYFSSDKIVVINNPIDIERVESASKEKDSYSFKPSNINLLSVSGLREEKRHDLMLKVLSLLPQQYFLTIVGGGEKEISLKALAKDLGLEDRVSFEGQQSNPYVYMKKADLFLLTSEREGFPNVLLEANLLGLPIVAFACKGGIEEIIKEGDNGFFVEFGKIEAMAQKIEFASTYSFDREAIKESTKEAYSKTVILNKYKKIFLI